MRLGVVVGQVVCTVKQPNVEHDKLLLVRGIGPDGELTGDMEVATDNLGAGFGEWVLVVSGSSARRTQQSLESPIDLSVIGIVDEMVMGDKLVYHK